MAGPAAAAAGTELGASDPAWTRRLERALAGHGVRPVYQPIVDLHRRTVAGYESLTRFEADDGSRAAPDEWFAAAFEHGVSEDLEVVTLAAALRHRADLPSNCFLTVNVEPESLLSPRIRRVLAAQGHLGGVVVEITEHRPFDIDALGGPLDWLRSEGALIAVDDAGAGYAGLQAILELRPSVLKLDRSLVEGVDVDETKAALVEMMGLFASRVDAWVLAEGVETLSEARRLAGLGVPLAQGYLFARPLPPWAPIADAVRAELAEFVRQTGDNLYALVESMPAVRMDRTGDGPVSFGRLGWLPVVDDGDRPLGLLSLESAMSGQLITTLVANVHSSPAEIAHRVSTASEEPNVPVLVTDNAGRYLGIVTVRRLLNRLAGA